jgi:hypothetical protein
MSEYRFVPHLPDLIDPGEYDDDLSGRLVRLRIRADEEGVEILSDGSRAAVIERLLEGLDPEEIEQMLCG